MKQELRALDEHGNGYLPLGLFYMGISEAGFRFDENIDYLKSIGALDESTTRHPRVRIANYVYGPSNCFTDSPFFSICCLSECESVMRDIEDSVAAPTASP